MARTRFVPPASGYALPARRANALQDMITDAIVAVFPPFLFLRRMSARRAGRRGPLAASAGRRSHVARLPSAP